MSVSTSLVRLLDTARIDCPGVTDGIIRKVLFSTLREFLRRTNIWLFELPVYVIPMTNDYILNTCQNAIVMRLMALEKPQYAPFQPVQYILNDPPQFIQHPSVIPDRETQNPYPRIPRDGGLLNAGTKCPILRILWNPGANETWVATLSMSVADPTDARGLPDTIPDWIIEKYFEYIAHGVIAKLMLQPNKSYSSPQIAQYNMRKFHEGVGIARTESRHMFTYSGQRWVYPQTFVTASKHKAV